MLITPDRLKHMSDDQVATAVSRYETLFEAMIDANDHLFMRLDRRDDVTAGLNQILDEWWTAYHELVEQQRQVKTGDLARRDDATIVHGIACYETLVEVMIMNNNNMLAAWAAHADANNGQIDILNSWSLFHSGLFRLHSAEIAKTVAVRPN